MSRRRIGTLTDAQLLASCASGVTLTFDERVRQKRLRENQRDALRRLEHAETLPQLQRRLLRVRRELASIEISIRVYERTQERRGTPH